MFTAKVDMPLFVKFWGTRGLIPTPGNSTRVYGSNTACVEVRSDDTIFVCDAGSGIREFGKDLATRSPRPKEIHLFISHHHWDHIQGFPFAPIYFHGIKVRVYGNGANDGSLQKLLCGQAGSEYFPGSFRSVGNEIAFDYLRGDDSEINGVHVRHVRLNHPGGCTGFIFEKDGKKIVYAPDNELEIAADEKFPDPMNEGELRRAPPALLAAVSEADLLILDGQYDDQQYAGKKGWGHSSCFSAVDLSIRAKAKNLAIFHHDPESNDPDIDAKIQSCYSRAEKHKSDLTIFAAREGVELKF